MDKDEKKAPAIALQAKAGIRSMARENRNRLAHMGQPARILPRQSATNTRRRVLRTDSGLIIR